MFLNFVRFANFVAKIVSHFLVAAQRLRVSVVNFVFFLPPYLRKARVHGVAQSIAQEIKDHQRGKNKNARQKYLKRGDEDVGRRIGQ